MTWFTNESQIEKQVLVELIRCLSKTAPELVALQTWITKHAEIPSINAQARQSFVNLITARVATLEKQNENLLSQLGQAQSQRDYWKALYDQESLLSTRANLVRANQQIGEQVKRAEAAEEEIIVLKAALAHEYQQAQEKERTWERLLAEQNTVIASQHQKLARLLGEE